MNHLAHTLISYPDEYSLVGNFLTDFLTLAEIKNLDSRYLEGVELHRRIDTFTDSHADVKECINIFRRHQQKYAPVVVDVIFDYFLIEHWSLWSCWPFDQYVDHVYNILKLHTEKMPTRMHQRVDRMIETDFLRSCSTYERLERTFIFIQSRTKFENNLHFAHLDLLENKAKLDKLFLNFFPQLLLHTQVR